uniref:Uncharacterized protein n=1 Tax=Panagrolaimus superbus TaxID=310955 RepID=A0A914Z3Y3_9BILA
MSYPRYVLLLPFIQANREFVETWISQNGDNINDSELFGGLYGRYAHITHLQGILSPLIVIEITKMMELIQPYDRFPLAKWIHEHFHKMRTFPIFELRTPPPSPTFEEDLENMPPPSNDMR